MREDQIQFDYISLCCFLLCFFFKLILIQIQATEKRFHQKMGGKDMVSSVHRRIIPEKHCINLFNSEEQSYKQKPGKR